MAKSRACTGLWSGTHKFWCLTNRLPLLDPQAEVELYQRFVELAAGRMTFLISHRIGSARLADRILVLDAGRIVEDGTHEALLAKNGL